MYRGQRLQFLWKPGKAQRSEFQVTLEIAKGDLGEDSAWGIVVIFKGFWFL